LIDSWEKVLNQDFENELVDLTRRLIAIPSVSGHEKDIGEFLRLTMENMKLEVQVQKVRENRPNVIGRLRGKTGKTGLLLNAHNDTIPVSNMRVDPFGGVVEKGRIYGRGAIDDKGPLAAMIMAAALIKRSDIELDKDLVVTAVCGEEAFRNRIGGIGTRYLVEKGISSDAAIVGETTNFGIGIAHIGLMFINFISEGKGIHSINRDQGVNAILNMVKFIDSLQDLQSRLEKKSHWLLGRPPVMNIGIIQGGILHNWVPESCRLGIDRRLIPGEMPKEVIQQFTDVIDHLKQKDPEVTIKIKPKILTETMETSRNETVAQMLQKACNLVLGRDTNYTGLPFGTDAYLLANRAKIPTVIFGPGDPKFIHSADENIAINELVDAAKIYAFVALALCK
jgi:acetylornithine deacetylase/succinyl-diaminopimelate desuccinylase family protein